MSTALASLGADDIDACIQCLLNVLGVADHVHDGDAGSMEFVDGLLRRNAHGADKQRSFLVNDDVNEVS